MSSPSKIEGNDPQPAWLDHMMEEPLEGCRPTRSAIDPCCHAAAWTDLVGIHAEQRAAPIGMGVQIDQARYDKSARRVDEEMPDCVETRG